MNPLQLPFCIKIFYCPSGFSQITNQQPNTIKPIFSAMNIPTQFATIQMWASLRLALGAALFITYFAYFCFYWFANFNKAERPLLYLKISDIGSKMYIFGLGVLLSISYGQGCIYTTIFTYFSMMATIGIMVVQLFNISETLKSKAFLVLYAVYFMWYVGIMSDFYITWKGA